MKTVPISGTLQSVSFFEDDTIDTVRQSVALAINSHPDRLFLEVRANLPKEYYATNPVNWTDLFLRLSFDGIRVPSGNLRVYLNQTRPGTGVTEQDITQEEWESKPESLRPLFDPDTDFYEWRILGVESVKSFVLPLPPQDIPQLRAVSRPIPQTQSLYETFHSYDISEIRATYVPDGASPGIKLNYYPRLQSDTPSTIEPLRDSLESARAQLLRLLELDTPKNETMTIVRAKWYIPLISTRFSAPRTRFEQIFYGVTVSKQTPYVGYFTAKTETTRHKFFVEDPKNKVPILDVPMWKSWTASTQPQRRRPTLLFYRGSSRTSFERIAITDKDITIDVRREKDSTDTLPEMALSAYSWLKTLDALMPFLVASDIETPRWELSDLSVVATYAKEIREFDMLRFPCLQSIFGYQNETFRLLRAEHVTENIAPRELQALQILTEEDAERTPQYLADRLNVPISVAQDLFGSIVDRLEDINLEKTLKSYPTVKFSPKEVLVKFVTNLERTIQYVNILRHVLTSESEEVDSVCPRRMERVTAKVIVPQQEIEIGDEFVADDDFNELLGFEVEPDGDAVADEDVSGLEPPLKTRKVRVQPRTVGTYNYFNNRVQSFDPETFDKSIFPNKCDKPRQPIVLTPGEKDRIGAVYNFSDAPDAQRLELADPTGTVICPPFWCMRDEIPLREDQIEYETDGSGRCPVCKGKVRTSDNLDTSEYPVIKRDAAAKYPDYLRQVSSLNKRKIPCCFQTPMSRTEVLAPKEEATYILDAKSTNAPPLRLIYVPADLAEQLGIQTSYPKTIKKGRIGSGESDIFRVGLGRPSKTLPILLNDKTPIVRPRDARENVVRCSFFRTWRDRGAGDTEVDRIVSSIDQAYQQGTLNVLEEFEYVTSFLKCEVIRVDMSSSQVVCGYWSDMVGASSRTIVLLDTTILARVDRVKDKKAYKSQYTVDLRAAPFKKAFSILKERHSRACSVNMPTLGDAIAELLSKGVSEYQVILDPFARIQAVIVPKQGILPIQPANVPPDRGVAVRTGYADIPNEDIPTGASARAFLESVKNEAFKVRSDIADVEGRIVELELHCGFRVPIQPEDGEGETREVTDTIRTNGEEMLVDGLPNSSDKKLAEDVSYSSEIYEFLLFSLSKDVQTDDYSDLREAIKSRSPNLVSFIQAWFKKEAYEDTTKTEVRFINKVRTPCGQFDGDESKCKSSSLCGWKTEKGKGVCKIRVKPIVEKSSLLRRLAKTLRENDKQRALVLDARMSPFFSTVLYLEMPNELITTTL